MYLNTLPEGDGNTAFPQVTSSTGTDCIDEDVVLSGGLSVQPVEGSAVLFCNVTRDGDLDSRLIHQGCPVTQGI